MENSGNDFQKFPESQISRILNIHMHILLDGNFETDIYNDAIFFKGPPQAPIFSGFFPIKLAL